MPKLKAKVLFDQGLTQFNKKQLATAAELFREAILEDPTYPEALYNLACCYAMLDERDNAIVYLDRSIKLDMQCLEWAQSDQEFDALREDEAFIKVLESNDPFGPGRPDDEEAGDFEAMDVEQLESVEDAPAADVPPRPVPEGELPPCPLCGALVEEERAGRFNPFLSLSIIGLGVAVTIALASMQYLHALLFGIPLISVGLWMFTRVQDVWVCQNCGVRGEEAGQPPPGSEDENAWNQSIEP